MKDYNEIIKKYPLLFDNINELEPFAMFGFECREGWYDIIEIACAEIYSKYKYQKYHLDYLQKSLDDFPGYLKNKRSFDKETPEEKIKADLVAQFDSHAKLVEDEIKKLPKFAQIKEKFGSLRLYMDNLSERVSAILNFAELMSQRTCEFCGDAGKTYHMRWHRTLCEKHAVENYGQEAVDKYNNKNAK
jgi:hypothetical protein